MTGAMPSLYALPNHHSPQRKGTKMEGKNQMAGLHPQAHTLWKTMKNHQHPQVRPPLSNLRKGKRGKAAQPRFPLPTLATLVLLLNSSNSASNKKPKTTSSDKKEKKGKKPKKRQER